MPTSDVIVLYSKQSTVNSLALERTMIGRSSMYTRNSIESNAVPRGTPLVVAAEFDCSSSVATLEARFRKF